MYKALRHHVVFMFVFTLLAGGVIPSDVVAKDKQNYTINLGDKAPDFSLPNAHGEMRSLADLLKKGPVVLSFYRGGWCPICNEQLQSYQADLESFQELGAQLVAVSPEKPESAQDTAVKNMLKFEVLSDEGNEIARLYDLVWSIPEESRDGFDAWLMSSEGKTLHDFNGLSNYELPIPATFVIRPNGEIAYLFRDQNFKNRAKNTDLINALGKN